MLLGTTTFVGLLNEGCRGVLLGAGGEACANLGVGGAAGVILGAGALTGAFAENEKIE